MEKAGIGFKFGKKFLDSEKKKNPKLNDAAATEAAMNCFLGTMWLMNSDVPQYVSDNLVHAYISGDDKYPNSVDKACVMVSAIDLGAPVDTHSSATSLVQGT